MNQHDQSKWDIFKLCSENHPLEKRSQNPEINQSSDENKDWNQVEVSSWWLCESNNMEVIYALPYSRLATIWKWFALPYSRLLFKTYFWVPNAVHNSELLNSLPSMYKPPCLGFPRYTICPFCILIHLIWTAFSLQTLSDKSQHASYYIIAFLNFIVFQFLFF